MSEDKIKQVIVMRKDLHMRRGKEISQGAHASTMWLANALTNAFVNNKLPDVSEVQKLWMKELFTKVTLQVNSEKELLDIYDKATNANLVTNLVEDAGLTEFHDIPTFTCLAIGPDYSSKIDPITKDLKLY